MPSPILAHKLLEFFAVDNGFDVPEPAQFPWISFKSSQIPLQIWLASSGDDSSSNPVFWIAYSIYPVAKRLGSELNIPLEASPPFALPNDARGLHRAADKLSLHALIRRAFQITDELPQASVEAFRLKTQHLPLSTEAERWVVQRMGQDLFRAQLLGYWQGRCALTGLDIPELLRASHIKPWADCPSDIERLDPWNGFLFAPQVDALFDRGFISFNDDGHILWSARINPQARAILGLEHVHRMEGITHAHRRYLPWHRNNVFQGG